MRTASRKIRFLLLSACLLPTLKTVAQRQYTTHSVLAEGQWRKLSVPRAGVYRISLQLLRNWGLPAEGQPSSSIRLFGTGGATIPEDNAIPRPDDLPEIAVSVIDGGDGILNGNDHILFYAPGPLRWQRSGSTWEHLPNIYADSTCYFITVGNQGLRVAADPAKPVVAIWEKEYSFRGVYEADRHNILSGGRQWMGERFSSLPEDALTRTFRMDAPENLRQGVLHARFAARSTSATKFDLSANGQLLGTLFPPAVPGNIFDTYASTVTGSFNVIAPADLSVTFAGNASAQGWIDYFTVEGLAPLRLPAQGALLFRDHRNYGAGKITGFEVAGADGNTVVWDVTDPRRPVKLSTDLIAGSLRFSRDAGILREFAAFKPDAIPEPDYIGSVENQDLHGQEPVEMLIIAPPAFLPQAEKLAAWRRSHQGLTVACVPPAQIWNEFGSGVADPSALRDFLKMHYDRKKLRFVLLMGRAGYRYKGAGSTLVPVWQSPVSLHGLNTHPSDDFYAFLDDNDDISRHGSLLDVAVGRLPVSTPEEAADAVEKIIRYQSAATYGPWRQEITFVADDEDNNLHLEDAEAVAHMLAEEVPGFHIRKIYLDAFPQEPGASGSRYPAVNDAIRERMNSGNLIWNYSGHGSASRLAEEVILSEASAAQWDNTDRPPLLITATCDFAPFDQPEIQPLGSQLLLRKQGGAIALLSTTRAVLAASNKVMNANYFREALRPDASGKMPLLGEGAMRAKNATYVQSPDVINNRKFQLLGDPAMAIAFPEERVFLDSVNGAVARETDSLKAMGFYRLSGSVRNGAGSVLGDFNGRVKITVSDVPGLQYTRGNDAGSSRVPFVEDDRVLYRGSDTVIAGRWKSGFIVPKDMSQSGGQAVMRFYAESDTRDAGGAWKGMRLSGTAEGQQQDTQGPKIGAWMDHEGFTDGGSTSASPVLLLRLKDVSGINVSGNGIGHDLTAVLDDSTQFFILNDYYNASLGTWQEGTVRFPLAGLSPGVHTLRIRAWDTRNNASDRVLRFMVGGAESGPEVWNYPNPANGFTRFMIRAPWEHVDVDVVITIFTASGQPVKRLRSTINTDNGRFGDIPWNTSASSGARLTPGIYFYQISLSKKDGGQRFLGGKLILY
ncbi:type IX secretion system sortase PorU [Chitinophaga deserti]|uniref:type IX secretion system sortase PorU n=1 Tax=Chitinophaga deserti TaxID=2164099 RepID=UPI000D6ABCD9|nr:type IX secretion system sortase PorU [Chitinophaga deserti]